MRVFEYGLLLILVGALVFFVGQAVSAVGDSIERSANMIADAGVSP
jgi:hypothetical protein